jgi:hypothetical protein
MEGNPMARKMKNFSRGMAVLTVPFTMSFAKVYHCADDLLVFLHRPELMDAK